MKLKKILAVLIMAAVAFSVFAEDMSKYTQVKPKFATGRTGKMSVAGNADDPAIWVHPTNPAKSLFFGVDKREGIWIWDFTGKEIHYFDPAGKPGNVEVRYGLNMGGGKKVDIVACNLRKVNGQTRSSKAAVYAINPNWTSAKDVLTMLCDGTTEGNDVSLATYGMTLYKDKAKDKIYLFEASDKAPYAPKQYEIVPNAKGDGVVLKHVRTLDYAGGVNEGMVADDDRGFFYMAEEDEGIHKYRAQADADTKAVNIFAPDSEGIEADREGLALYKVTPDTGYLILCDQRDKAEGTFSVYRIYDLATDKLVKTVVPLNLDGDNLWDDDGVDCISTPLPGFPNGIVVGHDGENSNYPVYDWADFAGKDLLKAGK